MTDKLTARESNLLLGRIRFAGWHSAKVIRSFRAAASGEQPKVDADAIAGLVRKGMLEQDDGMVRLTEAGIRYRRACGEES
jgi:hypothetical protein